MGRRTSTTRNETSETIGAAILTTVIVALALIMQIGAARAEGMLIKFQDGVLCDEADQVERIVAQHGKVPLRDVLVALNDTTGKVSCGMVRKPLMLFMEPLRVVDTGGKKFMIVKLTTLRGTIQFAWRPMSVDEDDKGESV